MKYNFKKYISIIASFSLVLSFSVFPFYTQKVEALSNITTSLDLGARGADVTTLQTFLAEDASIYPEKIISGYFGSLTEAAVKKFQARYNFETIGRVGPLTRAKINELIASGGLGTGTVVTTGQAPYIFGVTTTLSQQNNGVASSSVVVSWQTDKQAKGKVFYSTSPLIMSETSSSTMEPAISGGYVVTDDTFSTTKSITLSNLWSSTTTSPYYYMIEAIDAGGNVSVTWPKIFNSSGVSTSY